MHAVDKVFILRLSWDMLFHSDPFADESSSLRCIPDRIPVFPLPNIVFFPKTYLPLHIFEPRYREMIGDIAAEGQCAGMALLKEGWEQDYYGNPPIYEVGCVGRLISVQRLPDGRYNILLQGLHRYKIREEFYDKSYRQASIILAPCQRSGALDQVTRTELLRILNAYLRTHENAHVWQGFPDSNMKDEILINSLSASWGFSPNEKQFLLESDSLLQRARRLMDLIQFKRYERNGSKGLG